MHDVVSSGGRPLDPDVRTDMEGRFGAGLRRRPGARRRGGRASAKAVNAHAYTVGSNIVFQRDKYDPSSHAGQHHAGPRADPRRAAATGPVDGTSAPGGIKVSDPSRPVRAGGLGQRRTDDVVAAARPGTTGAGECGGPARGRGGAASRAARVRSRSSARARRKRSRFKVSSFSVRVKRKRNRRRPDRPLRPPSVTPTRTLADRPSAAARHALVDGRTRAAHPRPNRVVGRSRDAGPATQGREFRGERPDGGQVPQTGREGGRRDRRRAAGDAPRRTRDRHGRERAEGGEGGRRPGRSRGCQAAGLGAGGDEDRLRAGVGARQEAGPAAEAGAEVSPARQGRARKAGPVGKGGRRRRPSAGAPSRRAAAARGRVRPRCRATAAAAARRRRPTCGPSRTRPSPRSPAA